MRNGRDTVTLAQARDALAARTGTAPVTVAFDVTDAAAVGAALADVVAEHGVPDILVNNPGMQRRVPFVDVTVRTGTTSSRPTSPAGGRSAAAREGGIA